jgi:predicted secreted hydrolase
VEALANDADAGFARAIEPLPFSFPADHGPHPDFQVEWWYYTGNLTGEDGRHFGYQLTFFRRALVADVPERNSHLATRDVYMAHFALSDASGERFYAFERFSRDGGELAGAEGDPFRVFLEDWSAQAVPGVDAMRLRADAGEVALDLTIENTKPAALQGDQGLSQKGPTPGNASYYYSLTRMESTGEVRIGEIRYAVRGLSWMDREWSTSALEGGVVGWDWFSVQLDNDRELMIYLLRDAEGRLSPFSAGSIVREDGTTIALSRDDVTVTALGEWRSPRSGAKYPSGWRMHIPAEQVDIELQPWLRDQELPVTVVYWEGAVRVQGSYGGQPVVGNGYVELTGYAD